MSWVVDSDNLFMNGMSNMQTFEITNKLKDYLKGIEGIRENLTKYLTDKSIPLDERWDVFTEYGDDVLPVHPYYGVVNDPTWVKAWDDFGCDGMYNRSEVVRMESFIERVWFDKGDCQLVTDLKELALASGYYGFCNDW